MNKVLLRLAQISLINFLTISLLVFFQSRIPKKQSDSSVKQLKPMITLSNQTPESTGIINNNPLPTEEADPFSDVTKHNQKNDCWIIVNSHIYSISSYFGSHPGGDAVLEKYCGTDATVAFATKEKNPPSSHSSEAQAILNQYLVQ